MKILSDNFYTELEALIKDRFEQEENIQVIKKVDWEFEANRCLAAMTNYLNSITKDKLRYSDIEKIGVIDVCWNEYGSDIEIDFMPNNDFEIAYDEGCIMNNSAIDNDVFFEKHFGVNGEGAWKKIGNDYLEIVTIFYFIIKAVVPFLVEDESFKKLPKLSPSYFGFAGSHDEERTKFFTYTN
ncbi:hypothetical protein [uncultured Tenacibaculum sp.]|uniref:hypothetical protein n=1 Tax=uncultured Tenacibaculum sp. TaxID=174713 RepID=UPI00262B6777|nr:hypothetical protein [uncultured Tenacibaculum sp.]